MDRLDSMASISRCRLARMARRAPSISKPLSVMRRSRSFWYSRMPLANMRSMGPDILTFCCAPANNSFRLLPDQNSRSNSSLSFFTSLSDSSLRKMAAQLMTETSISINTTACTTQLAFNNS